MLELIANLFSQFQVAILVLAGLMILMFQKNRGQSQFRKREADREDLDRLIKSAPKPASRPAPAPPPLRLPGIRLEGEPHEILGIDATASESEIMNAYKEAIKRYHPDRIQGQAQEQLQFYQDASAKINAAKDTLIKAARNRSKS